jgi:hypothetical protein
MSTIAWSSIALALGCAVWIAIDEWRHPQQMGVMNVVWPVTAFYFSVLAVWAYYRIGRRKTREAMQNHSGDRETHRGGPTAAQVAVGTSHCGAGCMLADLAADFAIAALGIELFGSRLWAEFILDLAAAWALGIVFQYFAIVPMRNLSMGEGIVAAIKADTLSIVAFQVGMYAWMALTYFVLFPHPHLKPFDPRYWLMMQAGMILGYATSFPMNWFLIRRGLKEAM